MESSDEASTTMPYSGAAPPAAPSPDGGASGAFDALNRAQATEDAPKQDPGTSPAPADAPATTEQGPASTSGTDAATSMIIRTGAASVEVEKVEPAVAAAQQMVTRVGGFVANSNIQVGNEQYRQAVLELKIPAARFDELVNGLKPLGRVENVTVNAQDVGEEFVDVTARVGNARRLESRLIELLATRTGKLEDVLQVERELARVREEIDRYEGRLRFLRARVSMSTLTLTLHEPLPIVGDYSGSNPIARAFVRAWQHFVNFVAGFIEALGWMIPLGLILAGIGWVLYRLLRGVWRRMRSNTQPPSTPESTPTP